MYTEINGVRSECCLIKCEVQQGSVIGPLLYLIYVNDIFNVCNLIKCVFYADDTALIISCDNIATLFSNASKYIAMFSIWFSDDKLALNARKTNFVLFTPLINCLMIVKMNYILIYILLIVLIMFII